MPRRRIEQDKPTVTFNLKPQRKKRKKGRGEKRKAKGWLTALLNWERECVWGH